MDKKEEMEKNGLTAAFTDAKEIIEEQLFPAAVSTYLDIMLNSKDDPSNARQIADKIFEMTGLYQKGAAGGAHLPATGNGVQISAFLSGTNGEQFKIAVDGLETIAKGVINAQENSERDVKGDNESLPTGSFAQFPRSSEASEGRPSVPERDVEKE